MNGGGTGHTLAEDSPRSNAIADKIGEARRLLERGSFADAVSAAREAIAADGRCVDGYLILAELALKGGNLELARRMVAKAEQYETGSSRMKRWRESVATERKISPGAKDLSAGWVHFERREFGAAANCGARALKADKELGDAYILLGLVCLKVDKIKEAVGLFRQATEVAPSNQTYRHHLGTALRRAGNFEEAARAFRTALQIEPNSYASMMALAEVMLLSDASPAAGEILERILEKKPEDGTALYWLGNVRKRQGRLNEALSLHRRSVGAANWEVLPKPHAKPRVVFVVQHGPMWTTLASVYAAFAADSSWDTKIVAIPYLDTFCEGSHDKSLAIFDFLRNEKLPFVRWDEFKLEPGCADVMFLLKPHDHTRPPEWQAPNLLRFVARLAYVPYGLEIGGGAANADIQWNQPLQQIAWMVFARSERQKKLYAEHCLCGNAHLVVTGHPKMDAVRGLADVRDAALEAFIAGRKMVVWNAQYDVRPDGSAFPPGYSTFLRWWKFLPQEMARRPKLALVLRPHPIFFAILRQRGVMTEAEVEAFFAECTATGNIHIDRRMSYLPAFAASSAMMSDASSFLLEYAATGRPLLYLKNPKGPGLNADGEFFLKHSYVAEDEAQMSAFLDLIENGLDPRGNERRSAFTNYMHLPPEGVGATIKRAVEQRLSDEVSRPAVEVVPETIGMRPAPSLRSLVALNHLSST